MLTTAIYGIFHYHNYIRFLHQEEVLDRFYCSYKFNYSHTDVGIPAEQFRNYSLPVYIGEANNKLGLFNRYKVYTYCQDMLDSLVARTIKQDVPVLHVLHHGIFSKTIRKVRNQGGKVIGEAVNSHPEQAFDLISEERNRLGLTPFRELLPTHRRMIREIETFDYVLTPSRFVRESYLQRGIPADRIINIPYRCDTVRFKRTRKDLAERPFKVIYVAQITPRKGHIYLLEAWKKLQLPKAELLFIGSLPAEMKPVLDRYAGLFTYLGVKPKDTIYQYLNEASVFVIPSLEEGCSIAPLEAMACGIPVIATPNAGSSDLLEHGEDGFLVENRSVDQIAQYLEYLYMHRDDLAQMGENAYRKAEQKLTWPQYAGELARAVRQIRQSG